MQPPSGSGEGRAWEGRRGEGTRRAMEKKGKICISEIKKKNGEKGKSRKSRKKYNTCREI